MEKKIVCLHQLPKKFVCFQKHEKKIVCFELAKFCVLVRFKAWKCRERTSSDLKTYSFWGPKAGPTPSAKSACNPDSQCPLFAHLLTATNFNPPWPCHFPTTPMDVHTFDYFSNMSKEYNCIYITSLYKSKN